PRSRLLLRSLRHIRFPGRSNTSRERWTTGNWRVTTHDDAQASSRVGARSPGTLAFARLAFGSLRAATQGGVIWQITQISKLAWTIVGTATTVRLHCASVNRAARPTPPRLPAGLALTSKTYWNRRARSLMEEPSPTASSPIPRCGK